jgi:hypothetical protein
MAEVDHLQEAIDGWRALANGADPMLNDSMRHICERTAQSLESERDTGVAVCVCCHKPLREAYAPQKMFAQVSALTRT